MATTTPTTVRKTVAGVAVCVVAALGLSACGPFGGSSAPAPVASIDALSGRTTAIKLAPGIVKALGSLKLTPGTFGRAKLTKAGSLVFPITGGNVTVFKQGEVSPYVVGQVQHVGSGLTLKGGGTTVRLSNLDVDPGVSRVHGDVALNGKTAVRSAYLFTLDGRTLKPLRTKGATAILQGTKVEDSPVAAGLLNKTFGTLAVKGGLLVGTATITVNTN